jgi:hypothetical protein
LELDARERNITQNGSFCGAFDEYKSILENVRTTATQGISEFRVRLARSLMFSTTRNAIPRQVQSYYTVHSPFPVKIGGDPVDQEEHNSRSLSS